jgi:hypothetical protein
MGLKLNYGENIDWGRVSNRVMMKIFQPTREEVTGALRKLRKDKLHNLHSSLYVTMVITLRSLDSAVCTATGYGPRGRSSSPGGGRIFLLSMSFRPVLVPTQPPIHWVPGSLFPGVKRPRREADHSPPTSAEVKNTWIYKSAPPYVSMA